MNIRKLLAGVGVLSLLLSLSLPRKAAPLSAGRWLAGDFHNHTYLTDGNMAADDVFFYGFRNGLDWIANSEHGGAFYRTPKGVPWPKDTELLGSPPEGKMWRWQSLWHSSFPLIKEARAAYADKLVLQGYEWNMPTLSHASVGILGPEEDDGRAIARHEYLFDAADSGTSADTLLGVSGKETEESHAKALAGVKWLADNYPESSYCLINHPSRKQRYTIADLRDINDLAPRVAFGFEGMPGHQKNQSRGEYDQGPFLDALGADITAQARTYGGADLMLAELGGTWDALLGEVRRFFTLTNSDFHYPDHDFWPGEYAKIHTYVADTNHDGQTSPSELLSGLRSGNSYIAHGDLVNELEFMARSGQGQAEMGGTLAVGQGGEVEFLIRFRSPKTNHNNARVAVNHIDLIAGEVHAKADKYLDNGITPNPAYDKDHNETTRVLATFTNQEWHDSGDGWQTMTYRMQGVTRDMYFRLRGSNLGCGVARETDGQCNPLNDDLMAPNTLKKAYADLWFYANPLFVNVGH
jgi:hypothetical protein